MARRQSRVREVYEPLTVSPMVSGREDATAECRFMEGCEDYEDYEGYEGYERQVPGEGATDPYRNARTRVFAAVIQSGVVTSNQFSRVLRRSQVS
jgi:hypothetical protein